MKKVVFLIVMLFVITGVYADKISDEKFRDRFDLWKSGSQFNGLTKEMRVGGSISPSGRVSIELIDSVSESDLEGVPFDLGANGSNIFEANGPGGRKIGSFSMFSNSPYAEVSVTVDPLETGYSGGTHSIPYQIVFGYQYEIYGDDGRPVDMVPGKANCSSSQTTAISFSLSSDHQQINATGDLRVLVDQESAEAAPPGWYESNVTITMEVK